ncbi:MAG: electron transfer flavoprotein subunit alpha/FixB family protein, partial [Elusimicrobia bacterium]|nr:electron transfer flavoprotein subunit alpha/FixB family protein [Elusimicrobiota bacterium]
MKPPVLAVVELRGPEPTKASLEFVGQAAALARLLGAEPRALALGGEAGAAAGVLGRYGARRLLACAPPGISLLGARAFAEAAAPLLQRELPAAVLFPASPWGSELAARLAARLGADLVSHVTGWRIDPSGELRMSRSVYGGRLTEEVVFAPGKPWLFSLRPNLFPAEAVPGAGAAEVESVPPPSLGTRCSRLLDVSGAVRGEPALAEAEVVVSGGRGMGGASGFRILRELAETLGAAVGASRAAVDAGWMPPERQVGQTGTVVCPRLYVACGISGAMQHRAGIRDSRFIAAVNSDPQAPIFRFADAGIVGDLFEIVPLLTEGLRRRRGDARSVRKGG